MGLFFSKSDDGRFLSLAKNTSYGSDCVLKKRMVFAIYLDKGGILDSFHHKIVVSTEQHGCATLELGQDDGWIQLECHEFPGSVTGCQRIKEERCTFKDLAKKADKTIRSMPPRYDVVNNNCQHFCNRYLDEIGALHLQYATTPEVVAKIMGTGIIRATEWVWSLLKGK